MPRRELKYPQQVEEWLQSWGNSLKTPGEMTLIGSGALLWHAAQRGLITPLTENSMDIDSITASDEIAELCYEAHIGSEFERAHGWHINLMPQEALDGLPSDWSARAVQKNYQLLHLTVPAVSDLLVPKLKRNEPRDLAHAVWVHALGLDKMC